MADIPSKIRTEHPSSKCLEVLLLWQFAWWLILQLQSEFMYMILSSCNSKQPPNHRIHPDPRSLPIKPAFSYYACCVFQSWIFHSFEIWNKYTSMDMAYGSVYNLSQQNIVQCLALYQITYRKLCVHEYMYVNLCYDYCYCLCFVHSNYNVFINMPFSAEQFNRLVTF
jgi:hypothetical protein